MKRTLLFLLMLSLLTLSSCSLSIDDFIKVDKEEENGDDAMQNVKMTARITALGEKIEVDVLESEYTSGIHWVIYTEKTPVFDQNGKKISVDSLKVGDTVEILYSGQVMMSYPPQISARRITRIS